MNTEDVKETENEVIEFTEEELYAAAINGRTNGLLDILTEELGEEASLSLGANGFPCIDAVIEGNSCKISYFPVGNTDTDRFLLIIRTTVLSGDDNEDHTDRLFACESYNVGSTYGTAVFIPTDGTVEFRVSIPEMGGMRERSYYRFMLDMLIMGVDELKELLEDK